MTTACSATSHLQDQITRRIMIIVRHGKEDLAYFAGIIDGEGCFYSVVSANGRKEKHRYAALVIGQNDRRLLEWIQARYGGYISKATTNHYRWEIRGKKAIELAKRVKPYLIVKDKQVLRCIDSVCEYCKVST